MNYVNTLSRQNWSINAQNLAWQRFPQILRNKDNFSNNAADLLSNFFNLSHVVNVARVCRALEWGSLRWGLSLVPLFTLSQTDESLSFNKYFMRISYLFHGDCCSQKQVHRILSNQRSIFKNKKNIFRYHLF